jgi:hypothetical protein
MPNSNAETIVTIEDEDDGDYGPDDFGFVIGPDGELKSIMYPENLMEDPPIEIKKILKIFGIKNFEMLESRILH